VVVWRVSGELCEKCSVIQNSPFREIIPFQFTLNPLVKLNGVPGSHASNGIKAAAD
jgi:hypothetical protein